MKYFDGHNDTLLKLFLKKNRNIVNDFYEGNDFCHIDFPKMLKSNFCGGFFAIFTPNQEADDDLLKEMIKHKYDFPLPNKINQSYALETTVSMIQILREITASSSNKIKICTSGKDIKECERNNNIGVIVHIEGAEAIDKEFKSLNKLYEMGLRSIGIVWSRNNIFGHGVPFSYPSSPDRGLGLTPIGKDLVKICNEKKILIDLSHINQKGFYDVAKISNSPLIATHSNTHFISNHSRNLTNEQLQTISETNGIVGINFATSFLRKDGRMITETSLDVIIDHLEHLLDILGENNVAIGSDYDGAITPYDISDISKINNLNLHLQKKGYGKDLIEKIFYKNWICFLEKNLIS
tara:strand:+ start:15 stop:1067 length:1053 start_codon:yes stop_codon:yes gene_type:complete